MATDAGSAGGKTYDIGGLIMKRRSGYADVPGAALEGGSSRFESCWRATLVAARGLTAPGSVYRTAAIKPSATQLLSSVAACPGTSSSAYHSHSVSHKSSNVPSARTSSSAR